MDQVTGNTTLISDWGLEQIDAFALKTFFGPPCPVGAPTIQIHRTVLLDVPINWKHITWTNGSGT